MVDNFSESYTAPDASSAMALDFCNMIVDDFEAIESPKVERIAEEIWTAPSAPPVTREVAEAQGKVDGSEFSVAWASAFTEIESMKKDAIINFIGNLALS